MGLLEASIVFFACYFFVGVVLARTPEFMTNWIWFVFLGILWLILNPVLGALQGDWWIVHPDWTTNSSVLWWVSLFGGVVGLFFGDLPKKVR